MREGRARVAANFPAVDFPAPAPPHYSDQDASTRPWKKAAIVTAVIAAVELVVLVVVALAFIAKPFATDASAGPRLGGQRTAAGSASERSATPVLVLNGNGVPGAASKAAKTVKRLDYPVVRVTDASRKDFERTIVMYREGSRPAAVRLARDLDLPAKRAAPLDGMRAGGPHGRRARARHRQLTPIPAAGSLAAHVTAKAGPHTARHAPPRRENPCK